jgi:hypothetical protein
VRSGIGGGRTAMWEEEEEFLSDEGRRNLRKGWMERATGSEEKLDGMRTDHGIV